MAKIQAYEPRLRRKFKPDEVAGTVTKVFTFRKNGGPKDKSSPIFPPLDPAAQQAAIQASEVKTLADLRARSQPIPTEFVADYVVNMLFPGDPLLCMADYTSSFGTMRRSQIRGELTYTTLIVPSPMTAEMGCRKSDGAPSAHTEDNTGPRKYIVCEFDGGLLLDDQAALIWYLSGGAPLVCVCFSGGKSLHAWFNVEGTPEAMVLRFFRYAVSIGADSRLWSRSQFCRLPGGWNPDKQVVQEVHYLQPRSAWAELPEPPAIVAGFQWSIRSGAESWTSDSGEILIMSDPPLIDGIMRECEVGTVVGAAKTSKTWFTLGLGVAVATGSDFLGRKTHRAETLYLDYELKENTFRKRLCMIAPNKPEGFHYQCLRGVENLPTIDQIAAIIIARGIKLLVVDSLYRTGWLSEENSNDSTGRELAKLQQLAVKTNCSILVVDHTAKGGGNERSAVDASRGASTKGGFFDFIFVLRSSKGQDPDATYVVLDPVLRDWPGMKNLPLVSILWGPLSCRLNLEGEVPASDPNLLKVRILDTLPSEGSGISVRQLTESLNVSETTLRRALADLVGDGEVIEGKDPKHSQRVLFWLPGDELEPGSEPAPEGEDT